MVRLSKLRAPPPQQPSDKIRIVVWKFKSVKINEDKREEHYHDLPCLNHASTLVSDVFKGGSNIDLFATFGHSV